MTPVVTVPIAPGPAFSLAIKAPDDRLDYGFAAWLLPGEQLAPNPVVHAAPDGLVIDAVTLSGGVVVFWADAGSAGTTYEIECLAATAQGRTLRGRARLHVGSVGLDDPSIVAPVG